MDLSTPIGHRFTPASSVSKPKAKPAQTKLEVPKKIAPAATPKAGDSVTFSVAPEKLQSHTSQVTTEAPKAPKTVKAAPSPKVQTTGLGSFVSDTGTHSSTYSNETLQVGPNGTLMMMEEITNSPFTTTIVSQDSSSQTTNQTDKLTSYITSAVGSHSPLESIDYLKSGPTKEKAHAALLAVDMHTATSSTAASTTASASAVSGGWMSTLGGAGGALLLVHGLSKVATGSSAVERLEGVAESNWGGQMAMPTALGEMGAIASKSLGVVGGTIQAGLGVKKAIDGVKTHDKEKIGLGTAEALAGSCWVLCAAGVAASATGPLFVGITVGAKLYQHRDHLRSAAGSGAKKIEKSFPKATAALKAGVEKFSKALPKWKSPVQPGLT